jgi:hypothetical protein
MNSVEVLYAVLDTEDAGIPRYNTLMLLVPEGGAPVKVKVLPTIPYAVGACKTPEMDTSIEAVVAGATCIVNAVVLPSPEKVSVKKAAVEIWLPIYEILGSS